MDDGNTKITSMHLYPPAKTRTVAAQVVAEELKTVIIIRYTSYGEATKKKKKKKKSRRQSIRGVSSGVARASLSKRTC